MSSTPLPTYHVSSPSGSFRPPALDSHPPPSPSSMSPQLGASRPLISPSSGRPASRPLPKGLEDATIVHEDANCVVVLERAGRALASAGHLTFIIWPPLPSIYAFSPSDVPLLVRLHALARQLLDRHVLGRPSPSSPTTPSGRPDSPAFASPRHSMAPDEAPPPSPLETTHVFSSAQGGNPGGGSGQGRGTSSFPPRPVGGRPQLAERIGFVCSPFKDPLNPSLPNLTLHATLGPLDRASFWVRTGPFGPLGFYALDDLVAEIRESTSNNRIKSGASYVVPSQPTSSSAGEANDAGRYVRPIDRAQAVGGARFGEANGVEYGSAAPATDSPTDLAQGQAGEEDAFVGAAGGTVDRKGKGKEVQL